MKQLVMIRTGMLTISLLAVVIASGCDEKAEKNPKAVTGVAATEILVGAVDPNICAVSEEGPPTALGSEVVWRSPGLHSFTITFPAGKWPFAGSQAGIRVDA